MLVLWHCQGTSVDNAAVSTGLCVCVCVCVCRLKCSFAVSGSQDCTIKLWSLKGLQGVGMAGVEPTRLTVKYTQPAHDKVLLTNTRVTWPGCLSCDTDCFRTSILWTSLLTTVCLCQALRTRQLNCGELRTVRC